ncbi:hypothetical protein DPMN_161111 [Dreissena polymorpha]|uniref:Uncharacterized protein n=1 Tax=Dreissena polymorpha TaxID=45954 RepID=A0A9D4EP25_DREPO|nr:hypothetical protein DPMN_161111 [Dreissena polymorpha]
MTIKPHLTKIRCAPPVVWLDSSVLMTRDLPRSCIGRTGCHCLWISVLFGCGLIYGCFIDYVAVGCSLSEMQWRISKADVSVIDRCWDHNKADPTPQSMTSPSMEAPASTPPQQEQKYYYRPLEDLETSAFYSLITDTVASEPESPDDLPIQTEDEVYYLQPLQTAPATLSLSSTPSTMTAPPSTMTEQPSTMSATPPTTATTTSFTHATTNSPTHATKSSFTHAKKSSSTLAMKNTSTSTGIPSL